MWSFLVAFLFAAAITLALVGPFGFRRPRAKKGEGILLTMLLIFGILLVATWAGGMWITPIGPYAFGVPWLTYLLVALVAALIVAAALPNTPRERTGMSAIDPAVEPGRAAATAVFGITIWALMLLLIAALVSVAI